MLRHRYPTTFDGRNYAPPFRIPGMTNPCCQQHQFQPPIHFVVRPEFVHPQCSASIPNGLFWLPEHRLKMDCVCLFSLLASLKGYSQTKTCSFNEFGRASKLGGPKTNGFGGSQKKKTVRFGVWVASKFGEPQFALLEVRVVEALPASNFRSQIAQRFFG